MLRQREQCGQGWGDQRHGNWTTKRSRVSPGERYGQPHFVSFPTIYRQQHGEHRNDLTRGRGARDVVFSFPFSTFATMGDLHCWSKNFHLLQLVRVLSFFGMFNTILGGFPDVRKLIFGTILGGGAVKGRRGGPDRVINQGGIYSLNSFYQGRLLRFVVTVGRLDSSFLITRRNHIGRIGPRPNVNCVSLSCVVCGAI